MADIWFTSDTHFGQASFLTFRDSEGQPIRPFASVEEMDEHMIAQWNAVVKPSDKVYHLGDFGCAKTLPRLNGKKRLVVGNHDDLSDVLLQKHFEKILLWRLFKEEGFVCSHVPLHQECFGKARFNLHGHLHKNVLADARYINICVELTGYRPVSMDEIRRIIREIEASTKDVDVFDQRGLMFTNIQFAISGHAEKD